MLNRVGVGMGLAGGRRGLSTHPHPGTRGQSSPGRQAPTAAFSEAPAGQQKKRASPLP